jgi:hypothetical protein
MTNGVGWRTLQEAMERRQREGEEVNDTASFCAVLLMVAVALFALLKWWEVL